MVIDVNLTSHEDLKSSNFELFLYMSVNYKRKHQWTKNTRREERKHIQKSHIDLHDILQKSQGREIVRERDQKHEDRGST
jgi:hypothetical protein